MPKDRDKIKYSRKELEEIRLLMGNMDLSQEEQIRLSTLRVLMMDSEHVHPMLQSGQVASSSDDQAPEPTILMQACSIRLELEALANPLNDEAWKLFARHPFQTDRYVRFAGLCAEMIKENEEQIASNLVLRTPPSEVNHLIRNIRNAFGGKLTAYLGQAFELNDLLNELLGTNPAQVLKELAGNPDLPKRFPQLVKARIAGQEETISWNLIKNEEILEILKQLSAENDVQTCPFHTLHTLLVTDTELCLSDLSTQEEADFSLLSTPQTSMRSQSPEREDLLTEISLDSPQKPSPQKSQRFGFWSSIESIFSPNDDNPEQQHGAKPPQ